MGGVRTGIGRSLRCGINNCVPAPARRLLLLRGARAGAVISVDRQADLACHCLYVYQGGTGPAAGRGVKGLALRRRTQRRRLRCRAAGSSDWRWGRMTCPFKFARSDSDVV